MLNPRPVAPAAPAAISGAATSGAAATLAALLSERTGQDLMASRAWRIDSALQPVMRDGGYADLDALVAAVEGDATGKLADAVVDALLNQETSFFRDGGVVELAADILAERAADEPSRRVRLWSAGCSVGQEPYSLAMLLAERAKPGEPIPDIVATDVSAAAFARARVGRYSQFEIQRGLPIRRMLRWFEQEGEEDWVATGELVRMVSFRRHNLVTEPPPYGLFDVVLCRNVLMYFSSAVRRTVFDRLASAMRPGGVLILGAGETTIGQTERFVPSQRYRGGYDLAD